MLKDTSRSSHLRIALASASVFACLHGGCEWVMDIPEERERERDAEVDVIDGGPRDGGTPRRDTGTATDEDGQVDELDAETADDGAVVEEDGEVVDDDADVLDDAGEAGEPDTGEPEPCEEPVTWYADEDGDGYGVDTDTRAGCPKPAGNWATRGGDCQDDNGDVYPGQPKYFGTGYEDMQGLVSYDYDCSGTEVGLSTLVTSTASECGVAGILLCGGTGYLQTTDRVQDGINAFCGSTFYRLCSGAVLGECTSGNQTRAAYGCH